MLRISYSQKQMVRVPVQLSCKCPCYVEDCPPKWPVQRVGSLICVICFGGLNLLFWDGFWSVFLVKIAGGSPGNSLEVHVEGAEADVQRVWRCQARWCCLWKGRPEQGAFTGWQKVLLVTAFHPFYYLVLVFSALLWGNVTKNFLRLLY